MSRDDFNSTEDDYNSAPSGGQKRIQVKKILDLIPKLTKTDILITEKKGTSLEENKALFLKHRVLNASLMKKKENV